MKRLQAYSDHAYALLRLTSGLMFLFHGAQKVGGILSTYQPEIGSQLWIGGLIELFCGLFLVIGFKTRWAAFLASGTMAVAYIQFHWKFQFDANFFPTINKGELALIYALLFLFIACKGSGIWAIKKD
ncbi:MAG: putative oxidoreductase [Candidatus Marinamargulisbacteria bacterium]|jgi:putative oxidoreductase